MSASDSQTQNGIVAKNRPAKKTFDQQVAEAIANYKAKHTTATEQQIADFETKTRASVEASVVKLATSAEAQARKIRAENLKAFADKANIRFKVLRVIEGSGEIVIKERPLDPTEALSRQLQYKESGDIKAARTLECILAPSVDIVIRGLAIANKGGTVICYYLHTDMANKLNVTYAVSVCDKTDNFDALYGKEIAFDRMSEGKVCTVQIDHSGLVLNKFSDHDFKKLIREYQIIHFYSKESACPKTIAVTTNTQPATATA